MILNLCQLKLISVIVYTKVKLKLSDVFLTEHHAMKAYLGSGGTAPCIL